jgi:hypothetical protein
MKIIIKLERIIISWMYPRNNYPVYLSCVNIFSVYLLCVFSETKDIQHMYIEHALNIQTLSPKESRVTIKGLHRCQQ